MAKRLTALFLALMCLLSLSACGGESPDDPNYIQGHSAGKELSQTPAADDVFSLNTSSEDSFHPMKTTNAFNQLVCDLVYENMIEVDNSYEAQPNVITSWSSSDGGVHWKFTVDTGRRFHDGTQMTAADVAYSLNVAVNSDRFARRLNCVIGCSPDDNKVFSVTLSKANLLLPQLMAIPVIKSDTNKEEYPTGTGPYTFSKDHRSLLKFDLYPGSSSLPLDVIYLKEYTGVNGIISAFEDSLIDVVTNDPSAPTNLGYGSSNEKRGFNTTNMHYIGFNMKSPVFAYQAMRYAMNFAFDRAALVDQFAGYAVKANLPVNPVCAWYDEAYAKQFEYDLRQTQLVFSNTGLFDYDGDGYLEMKVGNEIQEINIDFVICSASIIKSNCAARFVSDMASLGLKVNVRELSWKDYTEALALGQYDMYYAEVRLTPDFDLTMLTLENARMNYGGIKDEFLVDVINRYLASDGADARKAACSDMCAQILNMGYFIPLCFEKHQIITHRGVIEGIKANENNPMYNFGSWVISFDNE